MKFTTKSILLKKGTPCLVTVFVPTNISICPITPGIWEEALSKFNEKLGKRESVTQKVDDVYVDIIGMAVEERMPSTASIKLIIIVKDEDVDRITNLKFCITGDLVYENNPDADLEELVIKNITYEGSDKKRHHILREKKEEITHE